MATDPASPSPTPIPSTEVNGTGNEAGEASTITDEQWQAMQDVLNAIYDHRGPEYDSLYRSTSRPSPIAQRSQIEHDPSKVFHRKVNKRVLPDYYDVIKEPMALSTVKAKINFKNYKTFSEFTRDFALIPHNAQLYNRPEAGAYQDALVVKSVLEGELKKLVDEKIIPTEDALLPDLGEIPAPSPRPAEEEGEDEEDEDDEEEDDEADDSDEDGKRRKKRKAVRSAGASKREGGGKADDDKGGADDPRKKRGRPPRVDTPMEARIKAVLKGLRKVKNADGSLKVGHFERLPDKTAMPEYFAEIKIPMAIDLIKRKAKRKKYQSVDHFMKDVDTMFENAKAYNQDESQIYKDALELQREAQNLAEQEKKKPDSDYMMEDGRLPLPNGILHNGELWKVGDWVHIQNPNDLTKPIVAQIYRTWQDAEGQKWVNACWYYRPEQTVHRYERHFFEHEVVKTGQYRDHHIDEVVDRCFVMFFTRFNKGRPRGFPPDKEVYVCEARYNEEKLKLNKIKTWASCLPDEVRDRDYEMDLFPVPKKMKKTPSPIKHLLADDAKEEDELPKPTWGVENAPPIVGAVHKRPREANESPPPEPTPSPPPQPPPPTRQEPRKHVDSSSGQGGSRASAAAQSQLATTPANTSQASYNRQRHQHSDSPAALAPNTGAAKYPTHHASDHSRFAPSSQTSGQMTSAQATAPHSSRDSYNASAASVSSRSVANTLANAYTPPTGPVEVYHLSDNANLAIPADIREQFQRDEHGRVLFFTTPPLDLLPPVREGAALGHSIGYLAAKAKRMREKRFGPAAASTSSADDHPPPSKKQKTETTDEAPSHPEPPLANTIVALRDRALDLFCAQMHRGTCDLYKDMFGERWEECMTWNDARRELLQQETAKRNAEREANERKREAARKVSLRGPGYFLDDVDPRY
ncbi:MAG: hypothetical protein M1817_004186 [Caeruleum heppii]|nr:MAG: hypothetical protein M1817_004186 [Caeruleum heppii]